MNVELAGGAFELRGDVDVVAPLFERCRRAAHAPSSSPTLRASPSPLGGRPHVTVDARIVDEVRFDDLQDAVVVYEQGAVRALRGSSGAVTVVDDSARVDVLPQGDGAHLHVAFPRGRADIDVFAGSTLAMAVAIAMRPAARFHIHAALLADAGGRGILIAGASGRGKSSTTIALLEHGGAWAGDDGAYLATNGGTIVAWPVPRPFHVGDAVLGAHPRLAPYVAAGAATSSGKRVLEPRDAWPGRTFSRMDAPFLLVFPTIVDAATTTAQALDNGTTLARLWEASALGTADGLPSFDAQAALLTKLASTSTAVALSLGADALADPTRIAAALAAVSRS